jgi:hypothetical protein
MGCRRYFRCDHRWSGAHHSRNAKPCVPNPFHGIFDYTSAASLEKHHFVYEACGAVASPIIHWFQRVRCPKYEPKQGRGNIRPSQKQRLRGRDWTAMVVTYVERMRIGGCFTRAHRFAACSHFSPIARICFGRQLPTLTTKQSNSETCSLRPSARPRILWRRSDFRRAAIDYSCALYDSQRL